MALHGYTDSQLKEAGWVVQFVAGASAYLHSIGHDLEKYKKETNRIFEHFKRADD